MFKKKIEDFICEYCGKKNTGSGFTNHCSQCLWSKHVDIDPGDREGNCGGLMEPIDVEKHGNDYRIVHKCLKCGFLRPNPVTKQDDFNAVLAVSQKAAEKKDV